MFSSAANPYDEIVGKATDENLASEDWGLNIEVCDKVGSDGASGARNVVAALQKRLVHRNPNVQLYALELANTLAQNCGKTVHGELASRSWTASLDRLVNDRSTNPAVKKKALGYIKDWAKQFEESGDANLGLMGELYDQLRAKNMSFGEPEPVPEDAADARQRQEDEELARVLELSKQDKGGRAAPYQTYQSPSAGAGASSSSAATAVANGGGGSGFGASSSRPTANQYPFNPQPQQNGSYRQTNAQAHTYETMNDPAPAPAPAVLDINTATRVRAIYQFVTTEVGELNFERGDVIKVLDRGFKEWWRGACNGKIGIFPVTYVEALAEPTPSELQEEAQEEVKVFASLGMVDRLLQLLRQIDTARGDRIDSNPEIEELYNESIGLQGQINALIKKYSDQKAELEHMNANFLRAMQQYQDLRNPQPYLAPQVPAAGYSPQPGMPAHSPYPAQVQHAQNPYYAQQAPAQQGHQSPYAPHSHNSDPYPAAAGSVPPGGHVAPGQPMPQDGYFPSHPQAQAQGQGLRMPEAQPSYPPVTPPIGHQNSQDSLATTAHQQAQQTGAGVAGLGAGTDAEAQHKAAWDEYYRLHPEALAAHQAQQAQAHAQTQGQGQEGQAPYPAVAQGGEGHNGVAQQGQAYGQSPYPAHSQGQQEQYGASQQHQQRPGSYYAPQHQAGGGSVENLAHGVQRMGVQ